MAMAEMFVHYKPSLFCLLCHQTAWNEVEAAEERVHYCIYCKKYFIYPTEKDKRPVCQK